MKKLFFDKNSYNKIGKVVDIFSKKHNLNITKSDINKQYKTVKTFTTPKYKKQFKTTQTKQILSPQYYIELSKHLRRTRRGNNFVTASKEEKKSLIEEWERMMAEMPKQQKQEFFANQVQEINRMNDTEKNEQMERERDVWEQMTPEERQKMFKLSMDNILNTNQPVMINTRPPPKDTIIIGDRELQQHINREYRKKLYNEQLRLKGLQNTRKEVREKLIKEGEGKTEILLPKIEHKLNTYIDKNKQNEEYVTTPIKETSLPVIIPKFEKQIDKIKTISDEKIEEKSPSKYKEDKLYTLGGDNESEDGGEMYWKVLEDRGITFEDSLSDSEKKELRHEFEKNPQILNSYKNTVLTKEDIGNIEKAGEEKPITVIPPAGSEELTRKQEKQYRQEFEETARPVYHKNIGLSEGYQRWLKALPYLQGHGRYYTDAIPGQPGVVTVKSPSPFRHELSQLADRVTPRGRYIFTIGEHNFKYKRSAHKEKEEDLFDRYYSLINAPKTNEKQLEDIKQKLINIRPSNIQYFRYLNEKEVTKLQKDFLEKHNKPYGNANIGNIHEPTEETQKAAVALHNYNVSNIKNPTEKVQRLILKRDIHAISSIQNVSPKIQAYVINKDKYLAFKIKNPTTPTLKIINNPLYRKKFVKQSTHNIMSIKDVSEELQKIAIKKEPRFIWHIKSPSEELQKVAVRVDPKALEDIKNPTPAVQLIAIKQDASLFKTLKHPTKEVKDFINSGKNLNFILKTDPFYIRNINNPTEEQQKIAITANGYAIKYIKNPSYKLQKMAIERQPYVIGDIKNPSNELQKLAVIGNPKTISFIMHPSNELQLIAVNKNPELIEKIKHPTDEAQLRAVKKDPSTFILIKNPTDGLLDYMVKKDKNVLLMINNNSFKLPNEKYNNMFQEVVLDKYKINKDKLLDKDFNNNTLQDIAVFMKENKKDFINYNDLKNTNYINQPVIKQLLNKQHGRGVDIKDVYEMDKGFEIQQPKDKIMYIKKYGQPAMSYYGGTMQSKFSPNFVFQVNIPKNALSGFYTNLPGSPKGNEKYATGDTLTKLENYRKEGYGHPTSKLQDLTLGWIRGTNLGNDTFYVEEIQSDIPRLSNDKTIGNKYEDELLRRYLMYMRERNPSSTIIIPGYRFKQINYGTGQDLYPIYDYLPGKYKFEKIPAHKLLGLLHVNTEKEYKDNRVNQLKLTNHVWVKKLDDNETK